jgi:hypothetical protein
MSRKNNFHIYAADFAENAIENIKIIKLIET